MQKTVIMVSRELSNQAQQDLHTRLREYLDGGLSSYVMGNFVFLTVDSKEVPKAVAWLADNGVEVLEVPETEWSVIILEGDISQDREMDLEIHLASRTCPFGIGKTQTGLIVRTDRVRTARDWLLEHGYVLEG
mgnify:FL=1